MNRSQLPLTNEVRFCVSGSVNIHPSAAIATNVVLHANPGSSIEIGAGTVVGRGSIIHAYGGSLVLETEATLGTKVLLFGHGRVGSHSCIGALTTIMGHIQVGANESVPPRTLQGEAEPRAVAPSSATNVHAEASSTQNVNGNSHNPGKRGSMDPIGNHTGGSVVDDIAANRQDKNDRRDAVLDDREAIAHPSSEGNTSTDNSPTTELTDPDCPESSVVYGQASVQRLITMMFPHRSQTLSENGKE